MALPELVRRLAELTGTPPETAETIYLAYLERTQSLTSEKPERIAA